MGFREEIARGDLHDRFRGTTVEFEAGKRPEVALAFFPAADEPEVSKMYIDNRRGSLFRVTRRFVHCTDEPLAAAYREPKAKRSPVNFRRDSPNISVNTIEDAKLRYFALRYFRTFGISKCHDGTKMAICANSSDFQLGRSIFQ